MQLVLGTTWVWGGIRRLACRGEYGHVGSTSDRLGGLGLIADTCSQSDQSGSVCLRDYDTVAVSPGPSGTGLASIRRNIGAVSGLCPSLRRTDPSPMPSSCGTKRGGGWSRTRTRLERFIKGLPGRTSAWVRYPRAGGTARRSP